MTFHFSVIAIVIAVAGSLVFISLSVLRWHRNKDSEELTSGIRDGDKGTLIAVGLLVLALVPFGEQIYEAGFLCVGLYVVYLIVKHVREECLEDRENTRPLTVQEQRIADDVLLYARKNKKIPLPTPPDRPTRQIMGRLTNEELRTCDRTEWPYNRLDWSLIDGPNAPVQGDT
jgi:hypothetical protein